MPYKDRETQLEAQREHYRNNKEIYLNHQRERSKKLKQWWLDFKSKLSCTECGENHPSCLDFHHKNKDDKKYSIGRMVSRYSKISMMEEIEKCKILCSNCHRKLHWNENGALV